MTFIQALLLGLLQGATEFIPVSSSGHLVLVPWLLGWESPSLVFDAVAHLGTSVAVVLYFWSDLYRLLIGWLRGVRAWLPGAQPLDASDRQQARLAWLIVLSAVPAGVLGLLFGDWFESLFGAPQAVGVFLILTSVLLAGSEWIRSATKSLRELSVPNAVAIGLFQALAIAPGVSRSGATISAGRLCGLNRDQATRFSFLIGVPVIVGAALSQCVGAIGDSSAEPWGLLLIGFAAAALSGLAAIRFLLRFVRGKRLYPFAIYCAGLGVAAIILGLVL